MKKIVLPVLLAASLLLGCGSNASLDEIAKEASEQTEDINTIQVFGIEFWDTSFDSHNYSEQSDAPEKAEKVVGNPINTDKRIVCWGDSLTEGTGGGGVTFPDVLAQLSGATVLNYGIFNDFASTAAARQGGSPQHVEDISMIPADTTPVKVNVVGDDGNWEIFCNFGDAGVNPCYIAGVAGTLSIDDSDGTRYFTRNAPGDPVYIDGGNNRFTTHAMLDKQEGDILVIWTGSSDGHLDNRSIESIIKRQRSMLAYANCEQYVIINYTADANIGDEMPAWNARLQEEYGEHYLDVNSYLIEHGLEEAGLAPTESDLQNIADGLVPKSLLSDESHGTGEFYRIVGERVYVKLLELGYIQ